jgi:hypothetical protein
MFYQLARVNGQDPPARVIYRGRDFEIGGGGLLLEPPSLTPFSDGENGFAVLLLAADAQTGRLRVSSHYPYRRTAPDRFEISNLTGAPLFTGHRSADGVVLLAATGDPFASGTTFEVHAAPTAPIPEAWRGVLHSEGFGVGFDGPPRWWHPLVARVVISFHALGRPRRRRQAERRLKMAWTASA